MTKISNTSISILGCGWFGLPLARALSQSGYNVSGSTTTPDKLPALQDAGITPFLVSFREHQASYDDLFFQSEILLINIPPKRNSGEQAEFLAKIQLIAEAARRNKVKQILFISSTAVYGDSGEIINELSSPIPDTPSGKSMLDAENYLKNIKDFHTTIVRFAGLIGPGRNPGRFFAGKENVPNGKAPVNLIHLDDCIGVVAEIINRNAFGNIFNACNPDHPEKQLYYTSAAQLTGLPLPSFNNELQNWKIVNSTQIPLLLNYKFKTSIWSKAEISE